MYLNLNGAESNGFEVFVHNANQELNNKYLKSTIHIFTSVEDTKSMAHDQVNGGGKGWVGSSVPNKFK